MSSMYNDKSSSRTVSLAEFVEARPRALMVPEVAALLRVSARQVYKLAAEHRIPSLRIAGCIRFDPSALAMWLRQKATPSEGAVCEEGSKNESTG
jgi:excisionase family DNA binding protein